jgi:hypothetical protein
MFQTNINLILIGMFNFLSMGLHQYVFLNMLFHWSYNMIVNLSLIVFLDLEKEQVWNNTTYNT